MALLDLALLRLAWLCLVRIGLAWHANSEEKFKQANKPDKPCVRGFMSSCGHTFKGSWVHVFMGSYVHAFIGSRVRGFMGSRVHGLA